ncbi:MAG: transporter substrate-binding domain-containing protein [Actinomycetota bacterium]|nr:transporter substrate-binding domain-containing protein [Actinomycetota bacterium]
MNGRRVKIVAALSVFVMAGAACSKSTPSTTNPPTNTGGGVPAFTTLEEGVLQVASCLDYAPFENVKNGEPYGFDIDMTDAIAAKIGFDKDHVHWVKANFGTIFTHVAGGAFDAVAAAATATGKLGASRAQTVTFSNYYYDARLSFAINPVQSPTITSWQQLGSGDSVGVQRGSTGADWAVTNLEPKGVTVKEYQDATDAIRDLSGGNVTAVVNDEPSSYAIAATMTDVKVVEPVGAVDKYAFAFAPTNQGLVDAWNYGLAQVIADGEYQTIFAKYFPGTPVPPEYTPGFVPSSPSA